MLRMKPTSASSIFQRRYPIGASIPKYRAASSINRSVPEKSRPRSRGCGLRHKAHNRPETRSTCPPNGQNSWRFPAHSSAARPERSEEHTSELQSLMRISYSVLRLKKKKLKHTTKNYKEDNKQ